MRMRNKYMAGIGILAVVMLLSLAPKGNQQFKFVIPEGWPKPVYNFKKNKISEEGFLLGRTLFNDPILSKDNSISCASCHLNFTAFTHVDHSLSHGIYGLKGTRNSLALFNLAWSKSFMWDGGVKSLELQPLNPITNPVEMDSKMEDVVAKLNKSSVYKKLFFAAFNDSAITGEYLLKSLAQFTVMLESYNSKYDSVMRKDDNAAFTQSEQNGYQLYRTHCAACHTEPLFTNNEYKNNGLPADTALNDFGRMKITKLPEDSLKFKVPSLRNVAITAPYMHDGRFPKLKDVLEHYTNGITHSPTLAPELNVKITLSIQEKKDLIAFLNTLTDKVFLYDVKYRAQVNY